MYVEVAPLARTVAFIGAAAERWFVMLEASTAGWFGLGIVGLIIWIAIAFWPARVARRKGHSWLGFFILSLFFFPLALIMAYVVRDRRAA